MSLSFMSDITIEQVDNDPALCWDGALSIGVAQVQPDMQMTEDLLKAADQALYKAKQQGGRQLAMAAA